MIFDGALNRIYILPNGDPAAVSDAKNMGVDGLGGLLPPHVEDDIGGLAAHARQ